MKATSWRSSALLLLALSGCRQLLDIEEGSIVKDAPIDVAIADAPIDELPCADTDGDGVCNALDTWPCGPAPAALPADVVWDEVEGADHATIHLIDATLNLQRALVVAPNTDIQLRGSWSIVDCVCPACLDQIEVGFAPTVGRVGCIYSGNPQGNMACAVLTTGMANLTLKSPVTPGAYTLRFRIGQDLQCGTQTTWWNNEEPPASASAVHLCVSP